MAIIRVKKMLMSENVSRHFRRLSGLVLFCALFASGAAFPWSAAHAQTPSIAELSVQLFPDAIDASDKATTTLLVSAGEVTGEVTVALGVTDADSQGSFVFTPSQLTFSGSDQRFQVVLVYTPPSEVHASTVRTVQVTLTPSVGDAVMANLEVADVDQLVADATIPATDITVLKHDLQFASAANPDGGPYVGGSTFTVSVFWGFEEVDQAEFITLLKQNPAKAEDAIGAISVEIDSLRLNALSYTFNWLGEVLGLDIVSDPTLSAGFFASLPVQVQSSDDDSYSLRAISVTPPTCAIATCGNQKLADTEFQVREGAIGDMFFFVEGNSQGNFFGSPDPTLSTVLNARTFVGPPVRRQLVSPQPEVTIAQDAAEATLMDTLIPDEHEDASSAAAVLAFTMTDAGADTFGSVLQGISFSVAYTVADPGHQAQLQDTLRGRLTCRDPDCGDGNVVASYQVSGTDDAVFERSGAFRSLTIPDGGDIRLHLQVWLDTAGSSSEVGDGSRFRLSLGTSGLTFAEADSSFVDHSWGGIMSEEITVDVEADRLTIRPAGSDNVVKTYGPTSGGPIGGALMLNFHLRDEHGNIDRDWAASAFTVDSVQVGGEMLSFEETDVTLADGANSSFEIRISRVTGGGEEGEDRQLMLSVSSGTAVFEGPAAPYNMDVDVIANTFVDNTGPDNTRFSDNLVSGQQGSVYLRYRYLGCSRFGVVDSSCRLDVNTESTAYVTIFSLACEEAGGTGTTCDPDPVNVIASEIPLEVEDGIFSLDRTFQVPALTDPGNTNTILRATVELNPAGLTGFIARGDDLIFDSDPIIGDTATPTVSSVFSIASTGAYAFAFAWDAAMDTRTAMDTTPFTVVDEDDYTLLWHEKGSAPVCGDDPSAYAAAPSLDFTAMGAEGFAGTVSGDFVDSNVHGGSNKIQAATAYCFILRVTDAAGQSDHTDPVEASTDEYDPSLDEIGAIGFPDHLEVLCPSCERSATKPLTGDGDGDGINNILDEYMLPPVGMTDAYADRTDISGGTTNQIPDIVDLYFGLPDRTMVQSVVRTCDIAEGEQILATSCAGITAGLLLHISPDATGKGIYRGGPGGLVDATTPGNLVDAATMLGSGTHWLTDPNAPMPTAVRLDVRPLISLDAPAAGAFVLVSQTALESAMSGSMDVTAMYAAKLSLQGPLPHGVLNVQVAASHVQEGEGDLVLTSTAVAAVTPLTSINQMSDVQVNLEAEASAGELQLTLRITLSSTDNISANSPFVDGNMLTHSFALIVGDTVDPTAPTSPSFSAVSERPYEITLSWGFADDRPNVGGPIVPLDDGKNYEIWHQQRADGETVCPTPESPVTEDTVEAAGYDDAQLGGLDFRGPAKVGDTFRRSISGDGIPIRGSDTVPILSGDTHCFILEANDNDASATDRSALATARMNANQVYSAPVSVTIPPYDPTLDVTGITGLPDHLEALYGGMRLANALASSLSNVMDTDGDGINNIVEAQLGNAGPSNDAYQATQANTDIPDIVELYFGVIGIGATPDNQPDVQLRTLSCDAVDRQTPATSCEGVTAGLLRHISPDADGKGIYVGSSQGTPLGAIPVEDDTPLGSGTHWLTDPDQTTPTAVRLDIKPVLSLSGPPEAIVSEMALRAALVHGMEGSSVTATYMAELSLLGPLPEEAADAEVNTAQVTAGAGALALIGPAVVSTVDLLNTANQMRNVQVDLKAEAKRGELPLTLAVTMESTDSVSARGFSPGGNVLTYVFSLVVGDVVTPTVSAEFSVVSDEPYQIDLSWGLASDRRTETGEPYNLMAAGNYALWYQDRPEDGTCPAADDNPGAAGYTMVDHAEELVTAVAAGGSLMLSSGFRRAGTSTLAILEAGDGYCFVLEAKDDADRSDYTAPQAVTLAAYNPSLDAASGSVTGLPDHLENVCSGCRSDADSTTDERTANTRDDDGDGINNVLETYLGGGSADAYRANAGDSAIPDIVEVYFGALDRTTIETQTLTCDAVAWQTPAASCGVAGMLLHISPDSNGKGVYVGSSGGSPLGAIPVDANTLLGSGTHWLTDPGSSSPKAVRLDIKPVLSLSGALDLFAPRPVAPARVTDAVTVQYQAELRLLGPVAHGASDIPVTVEATFSAGAQSTVTSTVADSFSSFNVSDPADQRISITVSAEVYLADEGAELGVVVTLGATTNISAHSRAAGLVLPALQTTLRFADEGTPPSVAQSFVPHLVDGMTPSLDRIGSVAADQTAWIFQSIPQVAILETAYSCAVIPGVDDPAEGAVSARNTVIFSLDMAVQEALEALEEPTLFHAEFHGSTIGVTCGDSDESLLGRTSFLVFPADSQDADRNANLIPDSEESASFPVDASGYAGLRYETGGQERQLRSPGLGLRLGSQAVFAQSPKLSRETVDPTLPAVLVPVSETILDFEAWCTGRPGCMASGSLVRFVFAVSADIAPEALYYKPVPRATGSGMTWCPMKADYAKEALQPIPARSLDCPLAGAAGHHHQAGLRDGLSFAPLNQSGVCPPAGDPAYVFAYDAEDPMAGLGPHLDTPQPGDRCVQLSITSNGPNDASPLDDVLADPGSLAVERISGDPGVEVFVDGFGAGGGGSWGLPALLLLSLFVLLSRLTGGMRRRAPALGAVLGAALLLAGVATPAQAQEPPWLPDSITAAAGISLIDPDTASAFEVDDDQDEGWRLGLEWLWREDYHILGLPASDLYVELSYADLGDAKVCADSGCGDGEVGVEYQAWNLGVRSVWSEWGHPSAQWLGRPFASVGYRYGRSNEDVSESNGIYWNVGTEWNLSLTEGARGFSVRTFYEAYDSDASALWVGIAWHPRTTERRAAPAPRRQPRARAERRREPVRQRPVERRRPAPVVAPGQCPAVDACACLEPVGRAPAGWYVQVAAYARRAQARDMRVRLESEGMRRVGLRTLSGSRGVVHAVRIASPGSCSAAMQIKERVDSMLNVDSIVRPWYDYPW